MKIVRLLKDIVEGIVALFYPNVCHVCGRTLVSGEKIVCLHCLATMPRLRDNNEAFNTVHKRIASTLPIENAASMFFYQKGNPYTTLILNAKYRNQPYIARHLGRMFASQLNDAGFFNGIDALTPVPLHRWKKIRRGYNQSEEIAKGVSDITGLPIITNLVGAHRHGTQTRRGVFQRWQNARNSYFPRRHAPTSISHILVIDDVITTGATVLSVCTALKEASPTLKISVLSLAITAQD